MKNEKNCCFEIMYILYRIGIEEEGKEGGEKRGRREKREERKEGGEKRGRREKREESPPLLIGNHFN